MKKLVIIIFYIIFNTIPPAYAAPLFPNSIVSNNLEFITTKDESSFSCITYTGVIRAEMPDKRKDELFANGVFSYISKFNDGTTVILWVHPDVGTKGAAEPYVNQVAQAIGKLPTIMRRGLDYVVILVGDEGAYAEDEGHFFVLYTDNINTRIKGHDLEETVFHESVHATLDYKYAKSQSWIKAQKADHNFITKYAAQKPQKEDMAESALFAWTILIHPKRLPDKVEKRAIEIMPNRIKFFEKIFKSQPIFFSIGKASSC
ncbi:MAG: hypothetical protein HRU29_11095 [Rhizobiales bacterium]|nr:hypothetical protein [Hyphomicrobiales bacterium]NRB14938.1 hypothetical protein [Hyphomicrobiales bacterium]